MGLIEDAIESYTARKKSAKVDPRQMTAPDQVKLALQGLDLSYDEIIALRPQIALDLKQGLDAGIPIYEIVFGMWMEGLAIGVELEKRR